MPAKRIDTGIGGLSDTPENANEEFGRGDQQFGGGTGSGTYGEQPLGVGTDGVVADRNVAGEPRIVPDDEMEGRALPGTDPDEMPVGRRDDDEATDPVDED